MLLMSKFEIKEDPKDFRFQIGGCAWGKSERDST